MARWVALSTRISHRAMGWRMRPTGSRWCVVLWMRCDARPRGGLDMTAERMLYNICNVDEAQLLCREFCQLKF